MGDDVCYFYGKREEIQFSKEERYNPRCLWDPTLTLDALTLHLHALVIDLYALALDLYALVNRN